MVILILPSSCAKCPIQPSFLVTYLSFAFRIFRFTVLRIHRLFPSEGHSCRVILRNVNKHRESHSSLEHYTHQALGITSKLMDRSTLFLSVF